MRVRQAAQFAITRATLQEARSAAGRSRGLSATAARLLARLDANGAHSRLSPSRPHEEWPHEQDAPKSPLRRWLELFAISPYRQTHDFVRPKAPQRIPPGQLPPQWGNTPPHGSNVVVVGRCGRVVVVLVAVVVVGG